MQTRREKEKEQKRRTSAKEWAKEQTKGFEATAVRLPQGIEWFNPKAGQVRVDFMPYLAGEGNPGADQGMEHFERTYHTHRFPLPNGKSGVYCCLWETFNRVCPICQWINEHANDHFDDENQAKKHKAFMGSIKAKKRHLWLVCDAPGDKKFTKDFKINKLKVYETNDWNKGMGFRELMVDAIGSNAKNEDFSSLKNGMTALLTIKTQPPFPGGKAYDAVTRIDFQSRDYSYPSEMLAANPCLDEMLIPAMPSKLRDKPLAKFTNDDWELCYEELKNRFSNGGISDDEKEEDEEKAPSSRGVDSEPDDEDEDEDDSEIEEKEKPKKKSSKAKDEEEDEPEDSELEEKDSELEEKGDSEVEEEDEDDSDVVDEEEEEKPSKGKKKKNDDPTAQEKGIKIGSRVVHAKHGKCDVLHISGDGTSLRIEDEEGEEYGGIAPSEVELASKKKEEKKPTKDEEEDDEPDSEIEEKDDSEIADEDDEPDDSETAEEDSEIEEKDDSEIEEEEEKPAKKPSKKPVKRK